MTWSEMRSYQSRGASRKFHLRAEVPPGAGHGSGYTSNAAAVNMEVPHATRCQSVRIMRGPPRMSFAEEFRQPPGTLHVEFFGGDFLRTGQCPDELSLA